MPSEQEQAMQNLVNEVLVEFITEVAQLNLQNPANVFAINVGVTRRRSEITDLSVLATIFVEELEATGVDGDERERLAEVIRRIIGGRVSNGNGRQDDGEEDGAEEEAAKKRRME